MATQIEHYHATPDIDFTDRLKQLRSRIAGRLSLGLRSEMIRYGLRRDLEVAIEHPQAKIPLSVRPLTEADLDTLLAIDETVTEEHDRLEILWRRGFAAKHVAGGYVAVDDRTGAPCYVQWLFSAADNDFIRSLGGFPQLAADEALLENAFTPPRYRGQRIMSAAMAMIAEQASTFGARYVTTYVGVDNIASLKGCKRSGFDPDILHCQKRYLFGTIRRDSFVRLADDDPRRNLTF